MLVHVLSAFPGPPEAPGNFAHVWLRESAALDSSGRHRCTEDPGEADIILFAENHPGSDPYLLGVADHPVYRRYPGKCFLYHDADVALPILRGIYPSVRRRDYQPERCRSGGYIARISQNESVAYHPEPVEREWLYSFFGEENSAVRSAIFAREHPRCFVRNTTGRRHWAMQDGPERRAFTQDFANAIQKSQFVLCPGGLGPSTYRLFETMEMGRVPVILSDEWVPVEGPHWAECSVRLAESQVADLEPLLSAYSHRHEEMGRLARENWEQHFAKAVAFHRLTELCLELREITPPPFSAVRARLKLLDKAYLRTWLRPKYRKWRARLGGKAN